MARNINIVLQNYTIQDYYDSSNTETIHESDIFHVYICDNICIEQIIEFAIYPEASTATIQFTKPDNIVGNLKIQLQSENAGSQYYLTAFDSTTCSPGCDPSGQLFIEPYIDDDNSPLTKNRKRLLIVVAILGVLCAPLPSGILP